MADVQAPPAGRPWLLYNLRFALPLLFGGVALLISSILYRQAQVAMAEVVYRRASPVAGMPADPLLPLYLFTGSLILLVSVTYFMLQLRSRMIEVRAQIDGEKTSFVRMAADAIRTPLTDLRWMIEVFLDGDFGRLTDQQRVAIGQMGAALQRLTAQANEILKIIKLSGGLIQYHPRTTDAHALVAAAVGDARPLADMKRQTIVYGPAGGGLTVTADPALIRHVLDVLLGNVVYLASAGETIDVRVQHDTGQAVIGIHFRGRRMRSDAVEGDVEIDPLGAMFKTDVEQQARLNLSVSREIMHAAKGRMWYRRSPDGQALFISLPVRSPSPPHPRFHLPFLSPT